MDLLVRRDVLIENHVQRRELRCRVWRGRSHVAAALEARPGLAPCSAERMGRDGDWNRQLPVPSKQGIALGIE